MDEELNCVQAKRRGGQPFFSIITCTFNSAEFLPETIASVEAQSFTEFEHIFIDAFSSDSTVSIIQAYRARCPGRVVLQQLAASGISNAMNAGIALAQGEVILHLHSDDQLASKQVLTRVHENFTVTQATIVIGNCKLTGREEIAYTWPENQLARVFLKTFFSAFMFYSNPVPHPSTYVRKGVFGRHGCFDERYKVVMDYDFWFRVFRHEKVFLTDEVLSVYRFHPNTVSTIQMVQGLGEIDRIREYHRKDYPVAYGVFLFILRPLLMLRRFFKNNGAA